MRRLVLLLEVIGVEERLCFLRVEGVGGRSLKTHGRIIQLGQFSLARQHTVSRPILVSPESLKPSESRPKAFDN